MLFLCIFSKTKCGNRNEKNFKNEKMNDKNPTFHS